MFRNSYLASEINDDHLELAHLQAEVELNEMERQAEADEKERQNALARARDKVKLFKRTDRNSGQVAQATIHGESAF